MKKTALLTAYDKTGLPDFARGLVSLNFEIIASGGTAKVLIDAGLPVIDIKHIVGDPILNHRVVTLSREVHAGILAVDNQQDNEELEKLNIRRIDLVYANLYDLAGKIAANEPKEVIIQNTDVGGPTLLHAASKGRRIVLHSPRQFDDVLGYLRDRERCNLHDTCVNGFIQALVVSAERSAAEHIELSAKYHESLLIGSEPTLVAKWSKAV